ncbi:MULTISPECIES: hypothetical protein [Rhodobacterales]|uniref:hypothetical protein n=1 Tax=Rhodobacterales TaxID=204455 RepID=UPI0011BDC19E|nr:MULTISPECIES: hypothetical protein [Rhodobacterales]MDO6590613.1 hypothetical protein [Yoonia sp. 1_MG-2023]
MDFGDMIGKAAGALGGGDFDLAETLGGAGIDASMLKGLDLSAAKTFIEEKGVDLSILDTLGLDLDELLAKFTGDA